MVDKIIKFQFIILSTIYLQREDNISLLYSQKFFKTFGINIDIKGINIDIKDE